MKRLRKLLKAYKNPENLNKEDFYLIQGIFAHLPEPKDYKVVMTGIEDDEQKPLKELMQAAMKAKIIRKNNGSATSRRGGVCVE